DVVVANAGIFNWGEFTDYSVELFQQMIDVNLTGVFNTCKATVPHMIAGGNGGSIMMISSAAGIKGQPFTPGYTAAKHGLVGLMKALANELGTNSIRVNSIHPTGVLTKMTEESDLMHIIFKHAETMGPLFMNSLPVAMLDANEISNAVIYLASDESRYVTGLEFKVDAGMTIR
ncbi:MAG TPA: SDR family oxidoreductase, partial [Ilumatobacteraceae bacterium]|nr:SDR family oxidoreductase [Ilumatobacteraceae bacterium]